MLASPWEDDQWSEPPLSEIHIRNDDVSAFGDHVYGSDAGRGDTVFGGDAVVRSTVKTSWNRRRATLLILGTTLCLSAIIGFSILIKGSRSPVPRFPSPSASVSSNVAGDDEGSGSQESGQIEDFTDSLIYRSSTPAPTSRFPDYRGPDPVPRQPTLSPVAPPPPTPSPTKEQKQKQNDEEQNKAEGQDELDETPVPTLEIRPHRTPEPTPQPTVRPTPQPTPRPTRTPTFAPTIRPTNVPVTSRPTSTPTSGPPSGTSAQSPTCPSFEAPPPLAGKKGVCMTLREEGLSGSWVTNLPLVRALKPYWNYSWSLRRLDTQPDDIEFIPMAWGVWNHDSLRQKLEDLRPFIESGQIKRLLGYNEPDKVNQSNLAVNDAVQGWSVLEETGLSLVSPSAAKAHESWMLEFMSAADDRCARVDWIGVHWYGGVNPENFKQYVTSIYELYNHRPIFLSEFAPADFAATTPADNRFSRQQVLSFMQDVIPWMEATEWVVGYAWFAFEIDSPQGATSALFFADGSMTELGEYYTSVSNSNPFGNQSIVVA